MFPNRRWYQHSKCNSQKHFWRGLVQSEGLELPGKSMFLRLDGLSSYDSPTSIDFKNGVKLLNFSVSVFLSAHRILWEINEHLYKF